MAVKQIVSEGVCDCGNISLGSSWSGGNQRELARAKNLKKQQEMAKKKGGESGEALKARKERYGNRSEAYIFQSLLKLTSISFFWLALQYSRQLVMMPRCKSMSKMSLCIIS